MEARRVIDTAFLITDSGNLDTVSCAMSVPGLSHRVIAIHPRLVITHQGPPLLSTSRGVVLPNLILEIFTRKVANCSSRSKEEIPVHLERIITYNNLTIYVNLI